MDMDGNGKINLTDLIKLKRKLTSLDEEISKIKFSEQSIIVTKGKKHQLRLIIEPLNVEQYDIKYKIEDESIARLDEYGNIEGLKAGTTIITATAGNEKQAKCIIEVKGEISEDGIINNDYFEIPIDGNTERDAILASYGIDNAIKYAKNNNIKFIKLETGHYFIDTVNIAIQLESNIDFDLNGSIIEVLRNSKPKYNLINISNVENTTIRNGVLIGDKELHDYDYQAESTHEWGHGIRIEHAKNITISNLDISMMTGDGIYINDFMSDENMRTENIIISSNNIHDIRRNGISVIAVDKLEIINNNIYNISGTKPQTGIDIERNFEKQSYKNVIIQNNKIYNHKNGSSIQLMDTAQNLQILNNDLAGRITAYRSSRVKREETFPYVSAREIMSMYDIIILNNRTINEEMIRKGEYNLTASNDNVNSLEIRTNQIHVEKVELDKTTLNLQIGEEKKLTETISPDSADYKAVEWYSSDDSIVTIKKGIVKARKAGNATITVKTLDGEKIATCDVFVY